MKKSPKKLTLDRETLRHLNTQTLPQAQGAGFTAEASCHVCYTVPGHSCKPEPTID
jgi:hypothetical protein